jgi:hypothetical protein
MDSWANIEGSVIRSMRKNAGFRNLEKVSIATGFQMNKSSAEGCNEDTENEDDLKPGWPGR